MAPKPDPLPDSFDPLETALDAERRDTAPDSPARTLLIKHNALADADLRHRNLQIASERGALVLKALTATAGLAAAALVAALLWDAAHADGLVIDAFSVPPDLQAQGLTGQEVASEVQDQLNALQAATQSTRAPESFANAWARDISVQIPSTGVSIGEVQRLLRGWLGHEVHVSGALVHTATGLRLVVRLPGQPADVANAAPGQVDVLMRKGAEALYGRTQTYRYGTYLWENGRVEEGRKVLSELAAHGEPGERAWALEGLANIDPDARSAIEGHRRALAQNPNLTLAWSNLATVEGAVGHTEAALDDSRHVVAAMRRPDHGQIDAKLVPQLLIGSLSAVAQLSGDFRTARAQLEQFLALPDFYGSQASGPSSRANAAAVSHDAADACRWAAMTGPDDAAASAALAQYGALVSPHLFCDQARGDWAGVVAQAGPLEAMAATASASGFQGARVDLLRSTVWPPQAEALAHLGRFADAEALLARTSLDCEPCLTSRGRVASLKRDWAGADHWFDEATRRNPSVPFAYEAWGRSVLDRGNAAGAIFWFKAAAQRGPHFADALEGWGEGLLLTGDPKLAEAKFKAAGFEAPMWGRNHLMWGEALARQGRAADARAQWLTARGLWLSPGDRARLDYLLKGGR
ncbi:MAG: hypothetical protein JWP35_3358 [Caulobacter sp.]|nr:hypothetical protein [Caulobacter sp.]